MLLSETSATEVPASPVDIEAEIVRESLCVRCRQGLRAFRSLTLVLLVVGALLWTEVRKGEEWRLVAWLGLTFLALCWRVLLCRRVLPRVKSPPVPMADLQRFQRAFFWNVIPLNFSMGAGMWWVASSGAADHAGALPLFVTLAMCFYAIGALINLSSHAPSFELALATNLGQAILFWSLQGADGLRIAVPLMVIAYLLFTLGRDNQQSFADSIRMRAQNTELVKQLQEALATSQEASRSKSTFLAAASHDLRQPLWAMTCNIASLAKHVHDQRPQDLVRKVRESCRTLGKLLGNLLDAARFDTGDVQPEIRTFDVDAVLCEIEAAYRPLAESKNLQWVLSAVHAPVSTDAVLLQRALGNIVHNAVKYTDVGTVSVTAELEPAHICITVADTGRGIPGEAHERVFDEFFQIGNPGRRSEAGFGLGLSIVRRIDRLLRLGVEMQSEPGRGTRFALRVPLGPALAVTADPPASTDVLENVAPLRLRVWVVEDDPGVRDALHTLLQDWGCNASCAGDSAALDALRKDEDDWPDALIADDMLGDGPSGLDIAGRYAAHLDRRHIIIMTGSTRPERRAEIRASGFNLIIKPAETGELFQHLKQIEAEVT